MQRRQDGSILQWGKEQHEQNWIGGDFKLVCHSSSDQVPLWYRKLSTVSAATATTASYTRARPQPSRQLGCGVTEGESKLWAGGTGNQESESDNGCPLPLLTATSHLLNPRPAVFPALYIYWLRFMNTSLDMSACDRPQSRTIACFPFLCFLSFTKGRSSARIKEGLIPSQVLEERIQCVV